MKNILLITSLILSFQIVNAQDTLVVIIRPALTLPVASIDPATLEQKPITLDDEPLKNMFVTTTPVIYKNNIFIIRFRDLRSKKLIKIGRLDSSMSVTVVANGKTYKRIIDPIEINMTDLNLDFGTLFNGDNIAQSTEVSISVNINNANYKILNSNLNLKYYNPKQHYQSLGQDLGGLWIPTLLYSTNLKSTNDGIPFASLPIGLAYGWKFYGKRGNFVGISGMGNWLIYTQPSSATSNTSFNLQGLTGGLLFDFSDVASIGCVYGKNFKSGGIDPGFMFVLGIGSKALGFFKKDKESKSVNSFNIMNIR